MSILVTGGAGYIGSHTVVELLNAGKDVIIVDNLVNSQRSALDRIKQIAHRDFAFYETDLLDAAAVDRIFDDNKIAAVIHFAGLKAVGESYAKPLLYYNNNLTGTLNLLQSMARHGVKRIVFSSSACVYTKCAHPPCKETDELGTTNPYGSTKLFIEGILADTCRADSEWSAVILRYFNPIGAHPSGLIGEHPNGIPNNLIPYVAQVAVGQLPYLRVFGDDYDTADGTGVRDYIHVVDLAKGHLRALDFCMEHTGAEAVNLGTGRGYSVLDVVRAFERASGVRIEYRVVPRRPGDVAVYYADCAKAEQLLGWRAELGLDQMCEDTWRFYQNFAQSKE